MKSRHVRVWSVLLVLLIVAAAGGNCNDTDQEEQLKEAREKVAQRIEGMTKDQKIMQGQETTNEESKPPNVVFMLVDDLGYGDLSFYGHPTSSTPHIDNLADNSRILNQYYVTTPLCSPSRAALLTGRVPVRSGVYPFVFWQNNTLGLPRNETTVAQLYKDKGYRTMIVGKWHLGVGAHGEYLPTNFGFDHYLGIPYAHDLCACHLCYVDRPCHPLCATDAVSCPLYRDTTIIEQPVNLTTVTERLLNEALLFVDKAIKDDVPFFLYFSFQHVHHPQFASPKFEGMSIRGLFGDSLNEVDWAVGEVASYLQDHNILSSTLLWFSSDNGPSMKRHERGGCSGLLRCGKGTTFEGGVRVPTFVHWPDKVPPGRSDGLVSVLDVLPTLAAINQLNTSNLVLDGVDISPVLFDATAQSPREMFGVYSTYPDPANEPFAVTNGTYKAHFFTMGSGLSDNDNYDHMCRESHPVTRHDPPLLYNLNNDPGERYNLGDDPSYSDVLKMLSDWRDYQRKIMTWMPARTLTQDPKAQPCCTNIDCEPFPKCCDCSYKDGKKKKKQDPQKKHHTSSRAHHINSILSHPGQELPFFRQLLNYFRKM